ncbi:AMP-binding protein [Aquisediminimonas sediminicola]|uniref:AMP-binding protein n=1 Tax=Alteraquisediminimonas sediminicola TaxID=2676787 RepID=UPI001C8E3FA5|nr:AMP-binding protein [Aquisediminimonas sediminicola]
MKAMVEALRPHAANIPDVLAIDGEKQLSWADLRSQVMRVAEVLRARFPDTSRPVATRFDHGMAHCIIDLALIEAAIPAIPLPAFFTPAQCEHALVNSGAQAMLAATDDVAHFCEIVPLPHAAARLPDHTAKISFTSGSTGTPKGICLSADHLFSVAQSVVDGVGSHHAGRHLALLPPGILLENVAGFYATMLAGGTYVALPQADIGLAEAFRPDFLKMIHVIRDQQITSLILVPEYLTGLVTVMEMTGIRLPALTLLAVGGARLAPALIERAVALGLPVRQGYGLTECASVVTLESDADAASAEGRGSVGRSLGLNRIDIADDGEVILIGPHYLGAIGEAEAPGILHSGDIGRIDDQGRLWIEGRKSNLIITSFGRNISPEWVEGALLAQPGIAQAMVHGDHQSRLGALIVPANAGADVAAAVAAANAQLPAYAQVDHVRLVAPFTPMNGQLTGNGRLKRADIASCYLKGAEALPFYDRLVAETREAQQQFLMVPQLNAGLAGQITRQAYIDYLTQAYHHVRHTVPLMQAARARLSHRPELIAALDEYIAEETGHEAWILADIDAAGGNGAGAGASAPAPATKAMVDHAYDVIRNGNPAAFFGMVYVLEGTSVAMASHGAGAVQQALGLPPEAFTYLTSHGALDQDHLRFFEGLMNQLDNAEDQQAIIDMARDMFGLFGGVFASISMENDLAA